MTNFTNPDPAQFARLRELPQDTPIHMLNLVELLDQADYQDGTVATGAEAYREYGRLSGPIFARVGGRIVWSGDFEFMVIGPEDEKWDVAFIAEYPNAKAFFEMVSDPDYRAIVHHRTAAVKTSRLIRLKPGESGAGFG